MQKFISISQSNALDHLDMFYNEIVCGGQMAEFGIPILWIGPAAYFKLAVEIDRHL